MANEYRTITGFVQFPPREGEAASKPVRNIVVNNVDYKRYSATLWPSHAGFAVEEGDLVVLEGKYTTSPNNKDGGVYNNLSVIRAKNLGAGDEGKEVAVEENAVAGAEAGSDIPF